MKGDGKGGLFVRATIHLPGIKLGDVVEADPEAEYVKACLAAGFLVPASRSAPDGAG